MVILKAVLMRIYLIADLSPARTPVHLTVIVIAMWVFIQFRLCSDKELWFGLGMMVFFLRTIDL